MSVTALGKTVFNSNDVKYPNGKAIEERNDELLAGCRSGVQAAELLEVSRSHPNIVIRRSSNRTGDDEGFTM